jgi:hypothetical protein
MLNHQALNENKLLLTIITVYKDNLNDLLATAVSLAGGEYEWIIVHGGVDNHSKYLEDLKITNFVYIHGQDDGIYDAMNKGLKTARGRYAWFLNAGDLSLIEDFTKITKLIKGMSNSKSIIFRQYNTDSAQLAKVSLWPILSIKWGIRPVPHQAVFFETRHLVSIGGYRTDIGVWSDQELILRTLRSGGYCKKKNVICAFKGGGVGSVHEESFESQMNNLNPMIPLRLIGALRVFKSRTQVIEND